MHVARARVSESGEGKEVRRMCVGVCVLQERETRVCVLMPGLERTGRTTQHKYPVPGHQCAYDTLTAMTAPGKSAAGYLRRSCSGPALLPIASTGHIF